MTGYYLIQLSLMLMSWLVSSRLKSKFQHYSKSSSQKWNVWKRNCRKMLR